MYRRGRLTFLALHFDMFVQNEQTVVDSFVGARPLANAAGWPTLNTYCVECQLEAGKWKRWTGRVSVGCQLKDGKWKRWTGRVSVVKDAEEEGRWEAQGC